MRFADTLIADRYLEVKSVAIELVARYRDQFTPKLLPSCAGRQEGAALAALDILACRLHKSREQFVADAADAGVDVTDFVKELERLAAVISG